MPASLHQIFESMGRLTSSVEHLTERIETYEERNINAIEQANKSRAAVHKRLDDLIDRVGDVEVVADEAKRKIAEVEQVTIEVTTLRAKAEGAGVLGRWIVWAATGLLAFAGWAMTAYTYLTGRPPP